LVVNANTNVPVKTESFAQATVIVTTVDLGQVFAPVIQCSAGMLAPFFAKVGVPAAATGNVLLQLGVVSVTDSTQAKIVPSIVA
jgi:hypothetical protein